MTPALRQTLLLAVVLLLGACAESPQRAEAPRQSTSRVSSDPSGATLYDIDSEASDIHILVYRGGTLARLGHNHVLSSKSLKGRAWLHENFVRSGFEMTLPVATLIIDDAAARAMHGEQFAAAVPQKDIDGTRRNLMKPEVLDGERFGEIKLVSATVAGTAQAPKVTARITIRQTTREIEMPLALQLDGPQLTASGEFDVLQTDFGMKPFSIALGALAVQDRLHVKYRIVATRQLKQ